MTTPHDPAWLCRQIVEHSELAILFADREGRIRLWNHGCEQIFGFTAAEVVGESLDVITPEKHRARHWQGYFGVMETGVTKYGREMLAVPALTKDGRRISIEFNILLVRGGEGKVLGAAATIQDVTARWERDKANRQRIEELEQRLKALGGALEAVPARGVK